MSNKEELQEKLDSLYDEKLLIEKRMENFEIDPYDFEDQYCDLLDECYGDFMGSYSASRVLQEVDPTAYRCGLIDYADGIDKEETEAYKELKEELDEIDDKIYDLEKEIGEL